MGSPIPRWQFYKREVMRWWNRNPESLTVSESDPPILAIVEQLIRHVKLNDTES